MEHEGQTIRRYPSYFCLGLWPFRVAGLFETPNIDFEANLASGRYHAVGFRQQELRGSSFQSLR